MIIALIFFILGVLVTIIVAEIYYKRSSREVPQWAKELIENLPTDPPTLTQLIRLFQRHLDTGDIQVHDVFKIVACPECGEPQQKLENRFYSDEFHDVLLISCPKCGWSDDAEV